MNPLFAERFKSARLMNGMSLQDLSDKLGNTVSRQALHKYEKGEVFPDSEMIGMLCDAFNVRSDFFTRESIVELGEISFRKLSKLPEKEQSKIKEQTKEVLSRYLELENILNISPTFNSPLHKTKSINSDKDIDNAADEVRESWDLGDDPISNVIELLENKGVKVFEMEASLDLDGLSTFVNGGLPVIVLNSNKLKYRDRKRFTVLHELAHLLLPLDGFDEKRVEKYCHAFAGALLLPKKSAFKELGEKRSKLSIQELGLIKQEYGISIQAIIFRALSLGIISEYYLKYFFKYINEMGWKVNEPYKLDGNEVSNRFDQLLYRAIAEEVISLSKAASLKNMKVSEFQTKSFSFQ
jgi:Zn-dependent peptidase ImmA (M78 family)/DNA-binding XRE family transcriptional regulator